jgi:Ca-activated chloride channel family protein
MSKSSLRYVIGLFAAVLMLIRGPTVRAAGLLIADGGSGGMMEIKEHNVHVTINNGIAVTEVTQVFQNNEDRVVEALYTFPVPRGASVANFSMWINGKEMVGEVLEKQRAREIYESYKQKRRDPGLLEQVDYRTFEMRVFPIAPRAEQKVKVVYYQELNVDHDVATYVYPLATQTRPGANTHTTGTFAINADIRSEIPITSIQSPSHKDAFAIAKHGENYAQASLEAKQGDLSRDVVLYYQIARPRTGIDVIASKHGGEDGYFAMTLTAGEELPQKDGVMDYVFVLDISGSMGDDGKLDTSRQSLGAFINALGEQDRFELLAFNVQPTPAFNALRKADAAAKAEAIKFLSSQQARGGTVLAPTMQTAYRYADTAQQNPRPLNVIILSDGMTEQKERAELLNLIKQRPAGARVFCIGVGNDVNRGLLEQLADESGGLCALISREDDFARQAEAFRRKLLRPVATDLKIDFGGIDVYDVEPRQLPNLYHGSPVRVYGRYKGSGTTKISLAGNVLGKPISQSVEIDLPDKDDTNPEIERMWAWRRVDRLLKEADAGEARNSSTIGEIVRLGEGYSIATEYTSFIVLENDAEYQRWQIQRKNALRVQRDEVAQKKLATELAAMRDKANESLGPVTVEDPARTLSTSGLPGSQQFASSQTPPTNGRSGSSRSRDLSLPSAGGGAIDPLGAILALGIAACGLCILRWQDAK